MESIMFNKMKVKADFKGHVINMPEDYPKGGLDFDIESEGHSFDFVHLFIESREQFQELFATAAQKCKPNALLWVSYPKSDRKNKYDINRDSLWDLSILLGYHPVSQISLDDKWSAVRFSVNEAGVLYSRPITKNKSE